MVRVHPSGTWSARAWPVFPPLAPLAVLKPGIAAETLPYDESDAHTNWERLVETPLAKEDPGWLKEETGHMLEEHGKALESWKGWWELHQDEYPERLKGTGDPNDGESP